MFVRRFSTEPPFMAQIRQILKTAMRSGDSTTKNTARDIMSAVKNANINKANSCVSDVSLHGLLQSLINTRNKSASEYIAGNRHELAENEHNEIKVLESLAAKIKVATEEEVDAKISEMMKKLGELPEDPKAKMGKVMSEIKKINTEVDWNASQKSVVSSVQKALGLRKFSTMRRYSHENPLGIPRRRSAGAAQIFKKRLPGVGKIILVASAKGGVGKSTVSVNLAQALFERGHSTGILDADIFGPSIPTMLALDSEPRIKDGMLLPLANYGLKAMSMGFLVPPDKAVSWRGLLVQKALQQLLFEVNWGSLDYLVIDMPPGTGDVQLTIAQQLAVDGAIVVTTPQDIALIDAVRGIDMFSSVKIPILGLVQNMSLFVCPNCKHETHIFGSDAALVEAKKRSIDVLANIPLSTEISGGGKFGKPVVLQETDSSKFYFDLADAVIKKLPVR